MIASRLVLSLLLAQTPNVPAKSGKAPVWTPKVVEIAQSIDLVKKEPFLSLTIELRSPDPRELRKLQPRREDFELTAGKLKLACRRLSGGSIPDEPNRLRFVLAFPLPPKGVKSVTLSASIGSQPGDSERELSFRGLTTGKGGQERQGAGWTAVVRSFEAVGYVPPSLPPTGQFLSKGGFADGKVFRKERSGAAPERAFVLAFSSHNLDLFDETLDVVGSLLVEGGESTPLIAALMRRDPGRAVKSPPFPPVIYAQFYFLVPEKVRAVGATVRLIRRAVGSRQVPVVLPDLPVPGSR